VLELLNLRKYLSVLYKIIKRLSDFIFAFSGLILFSPVMLILAVSIKISMGGNVIFSQLRPGKDGALFLMYKFRTMVIYEPEDQRTDEQRITPLGRWLRATSLDELPELINVVKGEMSLVGPRPLLIDYLSKYSPTQMRRHEVLPGITGLAQARGRNNLSWKNKFRYDVFYVEKASLLFDLRILCETINVVIFQKGFRSHGEPTRFDV
jgi:lipopolysaccharide/colanic/teichoic acid biosynthesis glycosyltransferase